MFAFTAASALAAEHDQLLDKPAGVALRSLKTAPEHFPDSLEFVNSGEVVLKAATVETNARRSSSGAFVRKIKVGEDPVLSLPWGVAEGDNCTFPTYFGPVTADAAHARRAGSLHHDQG